MAWRPFHNTPLGWGRVQAICDFVHNHITFGYILHATTGRLLRRTGTRRRVPGLHASGGRALPLHEHSGSLLHRLSGRYRGCESGADGFNAWFEVFFGSQWFTFDARRNVPALAALSLPAVGMPPILQFERCSDKRTEQLQGLDR